MSMAQTVNDHFWDLTQTTNALLPLSYIVYFSPNSSDKAPGGISGDTYSWWRNQTDTTDRTSWATLKAAMRNIYNDCSKGASKMDAQGYVGQAPDLVLTDQVSYETYEAALDDNTRYVNNWASKAVSAGFEAVKFKGAVVLWDEMAHDLVNSREWDSSTAPGEGCMYFLNTNFLHYYVDPATDLLVGNFVEPTTQDVRTAKILHYHALATSNRRKHGVIKQIDQSITS